MKKQTFKQFLQDIHLRKFPMIPDDQRQEEFNLWVSYWWEKDFFKYSELYGKKRYKEGKEEIIKLFNK